MPHTSRTRDFHFDLPDDWIDRTMIAWSAPQSPGRSVAPNVLIAYDTPRNGETLAAYVDRQLRDLMSKAKKFQLELRRDTELQGRKAVELVFQWDTGTTLLKQRQIYSLLPDGRTLTLVNTALSAEFEQIEPQFSAISNSFGWNEPA